VGPAMGSSPLTRGQLLDLATGTRDRGLIPAYTGKTRQSQTRSCDYWAHPRSRGENAVMARTVRSIMGASPLTRGKTEAE